MSSGKIVRSSARLTRDYIQSHPELYFVFGDNMVGRGYGGQAAACRGLPNTIGIPTKYRPDRLEDSYFTDARWSDDANVRHAILEAFERIEKVLYRGHNVIIPNAGIGTGLAELPRRAPKIYAGIKARIKELEQKFPLSGHS